MRIVFMGTPGFSVPCLERLVNDGYDVVGVVTQPDRPKGRKKILTPPPIKEAAEKHGLPVFQPERIKEAAEVQKIADLQPDLIVTAAYGQILPKEILDLPPHGCINVHASLLPKYRGGAPIHKAIIEGEKQSGITIMYMVPQLDAGDILTQVKVTIEEKDTVGTLHDKLSEAGAGLLGDTIPKLVKGEITPTPQDDEQATFAYNISRADEQLDWAKSSRALYDQVRGLNPWPVAFTHWNGKVLKVWAAEEADATFRKQAAEQQPGTVVDVSENGVVVATGDGALTLREVQPAGKKPMTVSDFVRGKGSQLRAGTRLGEQDE